LFARRVVLVEGAAESYLLPALAATVGFDLDGYGIVVASVDGTDFAPYARLLGPAALNRPFVVFTDGDVAESDNGGWAEPGMSRAAALLQVTSSPHYAAFKAKLQTVAAEEWSDGDARPGRDELVQDAADEGIYVGLHTLEVDIAALFDEEMTTAFNELASGPQRQKNFATAVTNAATSAPTDKVRTALLSRIERIGKGRYAQRLAAHVATVDLRERITGMLSIEDDDPIDREDLLNIEGCGPLLVLLHDLRQAVEGLPLLPTEDEYAEWSANDDDDIDENATDAAQSS
jgi:putative ATP-dependent endonuclease of OLD family